jgi:hypothetical protein
MLVLCLTDVIKKSNVMLRQKMTLGSMGNNSVKKSRLQKMTLGSIVYVLWDCSYG